MTLSTEMESMHLGCTLNGGDTKTLALSQAWGTGYVHPRHMLTPDTPYHFQVLQISQHGSGIHDEASTENR